MPDSPTTWLLVVAALHAGFQLTVDVVVYPALSDVADDRWAAAHRAHTGRITPLVALVYPALVATVLWVALLHPGRTGTWVAVAGAAVALAATAFVAAPVHGRLATVPTAERATLLRTLARADRARTAGALVCLAGALLLSAG